MNIIREYGIIELCMYAIIEGEKESTPFIEVLKEELETVKSLHEVELKVSDIDSKEVRKEVIDNCIEWATIELEGSEFKEFVHELIINSCNDEKMYQEYFEKWIA